MKNPIAPFSPVHFLGCALMATSGWIVYTCAIRHSPRGALWAIAVGTLGGLCLAVAPLPFEMTPEKGKASP